MELSNLTSETLSPTHTICFMKVKGETFRFALTDHPPIEAHWGSGVITPRILDLGTRWT